MNYENGINGEAEWDPAEVRAWARERRLGVGERGRIPEAVIELYLAQPATVRKWASTQGIEVSERVDSQPTWSSGTSLVRPQCGPGPVARASRSASAVAFRRPSWIDSWTGSASSSPRQLDPRRRVEVRTRFSFLARVVPRHFRTREEPADG